MMAVVTVTALILLVATNPDRHDGTTDKRVVIPVASTVAATYGVLAMRRPLLSLLPLLAVWVATPQVDHPTPDVINVSAGGCFLGWVIGAPVGWFSRRLAGAGSCRPVALNPPEMNRLAPRASVDFSTSQGATDQETSPNSFRSDG
jgi:hypothetical protein